MGLLESKGVVLGAIVGLVAGGVAVGVLCGLHESDPPPLDRGRAFSIVGGEQAAELAARFRPWLRFDEKERWRPLSIPSLFEERERDGSPGQRFCTRTAAEKPDCVPIASMPDFTRLTAENSTLGASTYVDISGKDLKEYHAPNRRRSCREQGLLDCGDIDSSAIYYRVTSSNARYYIDYWWFLRYNHFPGASLTCLHPTVLCDEHEGDWEGVTLVTGPDDSEHLDYVAYAAHKGVFRYPADELRMHGEGRPEVFVARGSHAAYPRPCSSPCFQPAALAVGHLFDVPEASTDGGDEWERNGASCKVGTPASCLLPLPASETEPGAWTVWPGLWGVACGARCEKSGHPQSPDSPGRQGRFQSPWCSSLAGGGVICDGTVQGCGDWLGPVVVALACDPALLAQGLTTPAELSPGRLELSVIARRGAEPNLVSATTRGIVQALGEPLGPGGRVVVSGARPSTEILVRARRGWNLVEARFEPFSGPGPGNRFEVEVRSRRGHPRLIGSDEGGARVRAVEERRIRLQKSA